MASHKQSHEECYGGAITALRRGDESLPRPAMRRGRGGGGVRQAANFAAGFAEQKVRRAFMAKVLTIVGLQLAFTAGCAFVFYFVQPLKVCPCFPDRVSVYQIHVAGPACFCPCYSSLRGLL